MNLPNKLNCYKKSIVSKFPIILKLLEDGEYEILTLYHKVIPDIKNVAEFIEILDCLFALNKIGYNEEKRSFYYVA